jgi:hypothetical protein
MLDIVYGKQNGKIIKGQQKLIKTTAKNSITWCFFNTGMPKCFTKAANVTAVWFAS